MKAKLDELWAEKPAGAVVVQRPEITLLCGAGTTAITYPDWFGVDLRFEEPIRVPANFIRAALAFSSAQLKTLRANGLFPKELNPSLFKFQLSFKVLFTTVASVFFFFTSPKFRRSCTRRSSVSSGGRSTLMAQQAIWCEAELANPPGL